MIRARHVSVKTANVWTVSVQMINAYAGVGKNVPQHLLIASAVIIVNAKIVAVN